MKSEYIHEERVSGTTSDLWKLFGKFCFYVAGLVYLICCVF